MRFGAAQLVLAAAAAAATVGHGPAMEVEVRSAAGTCFVGDTLDVQAPFAPDGAGTFAENCVSPFTSGILQHDTFSDLVVEAGTHLCEEESTDIYPSRDADSGSRPPSDGHREYIGLNDWLRGVVTALLGLSGGLVFAAAVRGRRDGARRARAAECVQAAARGYLLRRAARFFYRAAWTIQRRWRARVRCAMARELALGLIHRAAIKIQSQARRKAMMVAAATTIQAGWRNALDYWWWRFWYVHDGNVATLHPDNSLDLDLFDYKRLNVVEEQWESVSCAAVLVQAAIRGFLVRVEMGLAQLRTTFGGKSPASVMRARVVHAPLIDFIIFDRATGKEVPWDDLVRRHGVKPKKMSNARKQRSKKKEKARREQCSGPVFSHDGQFYMIPATASKRYNAFLRERMGRAKADHLVRMVRSASLINGLGGGNDDDAFDVWAAEGTRA